MFSVIPDQQIICFTYNVSHSGISDVLHYLKPIKLLTNVAKHQTPTQDSWVVCQNTLYDATYIFYCPY